MDNLRNKNNRGYGKKHGPENTERKDQVDIMENRNEKMAGPDEKNVEFPEEMEIADRQSGDSGFENDVVEKLKRDLEVARGEAADAHDRLLRATAEFENFKKRTQRQVDEHRKYANESLIKELLSVVDNLERAISASAEKLSKEESCMLEGIEMTLSEILKILKKYNVTPIEAQGKPFDPAYHEAVMQVESDEHPENTVINEYQKGFLLHDRVIRPSMVVVSKGSQTSSNNK